MSDFAKPPEAMAGLVPEVFAGRKSRRAEAVKPKGAWNEAVPGSEDDFAPGPRQFAVCGQDAHLAE